MDFLIYLLKVNIAITAFYALYRLMFQRDTFFVWKRAVLLMMVAFAVFYPLTEFYSWFVAQFNVVETSELYAVSLDAFTFAPVAVQPEKSFSFAKILPNVLLITYLAGVTYCLVRIVVQFFSILTVLRDSEKREIFGQKTLVSQKVETPFSFFGTIVLGNKNYTDGELREILLHEQTHKRQWHSIDVLLGEMLCVLAWFNPLAWRLQREIRLNLEFLADNAVVLSGCDVADYQLNLLKLSYQKNIPSITNNFNVSPLKKRIIMMKKSNSKSRAMLKYALLLPTVALMIGVNLSVNAQNKSKEPAQKVPSSTATRAETKTYEFRTKAGAVTLNGMAGEPIYALDGKIVSKRELETAGSDDKTEIVTVSAILPQEATKLFGERGKNGAFSISTKKSATINIRTGEGSIPENALYIVDGKEVTYFAFQTLNPDNIESITVLKDANATKLYGEKGKNGVIVITLKQSDNKKLKNDNAVFEVVEQMPEFAGGMDALMKYLAENLRYPKDAMQKEIQGRVTVRFIIEADGTVGDEVEILRSVSESLDAEAIRVVKAMPAWKPGMQRGKAVRVHFTLPIVFKMQGKESENGNADVVVAGYPPKTNVETINIRTKEGSISENVLFIVDGKEIPYAGLNSIPTQSIESIEVLKDASATKLYSDKGKNGVIVITTKKK